MNLKRGNVNRIWPFAMALVVTVAAVIAVASSSTGWVSAQSGTGGTDGTGGTGPGPTATTTPGGTGGTGGLPELRSIIFQGEVTIGGQLSPNGFRLTAKILSTTGQVLFTSVPAIVGLPLDSRYSALVVGPAPNAEGRVIEFWLDDQVVSSNVSVFAPLLNGQVCLGCAWTLPILRSLDLDFPTAPVSTPTPTPGGTGGTGGTGGPTPTPAHATPTPTPTGTGGTGGPTPTPVIPTPTPTPFIPTPTPGGTGGTGGPTPTSVPPTATPTTIPDDPACRADNNGDQQIDKEEAIQAVIGYLFGIGDWTREEAVDAVTVYLTGQTLTCETPPQGGNLKVALGAPISTLDVHRTTGTTAYEIAFAVQESLFAYDDQMTSQPLLVESWSVSSDGLQWDFTLRDGLKFHNGRSVTAEDAAQSWARWADRDNYGSLIFGFVDDIRVTGNLTFEIDMVEPTALILEGMASIGGYAPYIMPPEMYNVPAATGADVMIGTGPYKFREWVQGDHLTVERFEEYQPVNSPSSFMAGRKEAFFDLVDYVVIPDVNTQIAALEVGQIDIIAGAIPGDFVDPLSNDPDLRVQIIENDSSRDGAWLDHVDGPFTDARVRRAFAMAYPVEQALNAAVGDQRFWQTCPSMMVCGGKWGGFPDGSAGIYNARSSGGLQAAQQIIHNLGLVGTDVIVMQPADRPRFAGPAEISRQTLEELGFNVIFKVTDWATQTVWRETPELWDVFHTAGGGRWGANPLLNSSLRKNGYWNRYQDESGRMAAGMNALARATSAAEQLQIVKDMQQVFWEDIPYVSIGDTFYAVALKADIQGAKTKFGMPFNVYNAWRTE